MGWTPEVRISINKVIYISFELNLTTALCVEFTGGTVNFLAVPVWVGCLLLVNCIMVTNCNIFTVAENCTACLLSRATGVTVLANNLV